MPHANEPTFYVDECLDSDDFVEPLRHAGFDIVRHKDIFTPGVSDERWIKEVSEEGYFALTKDNVIARTRYQTDLVMANNLGLFIIRCTKGTHSQKAQLVVKHKRPLFRFIKRNYPPFIAKITVSKGVFGFRPEDRDWGQKYPKDGKPT